MITAAVVAVVVGAATSAIGRLQAEAPVVARAGLWMGTVQRGEMLREVQGNGTLVPEHIQWVTALSAARVENIFVRPGATVEPDTVLLELGNPDLELQALEAERQVGAAKAVLADLKATLRNEKLAQEVSVSTLRIDRLTAQRKATANLELGEQGYVSADDKQTASAQLEALDRRVELEQQRLGVLGDGMRERVAAQAAQIERLETIVRFRREQLAALRVKAGVAGTLQELPLEAGQWVNPGGLLAKIARPDLLKARLAIPETLAKDVAIGLTAHIDTRNGIIDGKVSRVNPAASGGTVTVDVALEGPLPKGARPDLTVVGTVELERLPDVLYVRRPAFAQPDSTVGVFHLEPGGQHATRSNVQFGRASVTNIEVLAGLAEGEQIILSDMSMWDARDRLKLE